MRNKKKNTSREEVIKKEANQFKMLEFTENAKEKVNRHIRVSTFVLTIILIYIFFLTYQYLSVKPTKSVMVESGILEESGNFEAMIIRSEENVYATNSGIADMFIPAGTTAKRGEVVCSVSHDTGKRNQILENLSTEKARLTSTIDYDPQTLKKYQSFFREYAVNLNYHEFELTNQVVLELNNILNNSTLSYTIQDQGNYQKVMDNLEVYRQQMESIGKSYSVDKSSTIIYISDGLEDISPESFQPTDLKREAKPVNRLENPEVTAKEFLFKKVDNLSCYFAAKIDGIAYNYLEKAMKSSGYVDLFFPSKNLNMTVKIEKIEPFENGYVALFMADRFINKFLEERFLPIQITYNQYNGLKVPNSSIDLKTTLIIPKTAVEVDDRGDYFVRKKDLDNKKNITGIATRIKVYGETKEDYFILPVDDATALVKNTEILMKNPSTEEYKEYKIEREEKMYGVYVLNKGYADFKRIKLLYQSDNFSIVQKFYSYSIKIYDQIASEAHNVKEFSLIR